MILIKISFLVFFLTFFTACHLFFSKPDVTPEVTPESVNPEGSSSSDRGQSVSPEPDNPNLPADSGAQTPFSGEIGSSTTQVIKTTLSEEQLKDFFKAVKEGDLQKVNLALEAGADPTLMDEENNTVLIMAVDGGYTDIVKRFLKEKSITPQSLNHSNTEGDTALTLSAKKGDLEIMGLLLNAGADPMYPSLMGYTPLFLAATYDHIALARRLLDIPQVKASLNKGETHYKMIGLGNHKRVKQFVFLGTISAICYKRGDIRSEATSYGMEMVDLLLEKGADPLAVPSDSADEIALEMVVSCSHKPLLQKLLRIPSFRQSVTDTAKGRETFVWAVGARPETMESFLKAGIDFLTPIIGGNNFLMLLVQDFTSHPSPSPYCPNYLRGSYQTERDDESLKIVKEVLSTPAFKENINMRNKNGETTLFLAAKHSCSVMVDLLLDEGADPTIPNAEGRTIFQVANPGRYSDLLHSEAKAILNRLLEISAIRQSIKPWRQGTCATCEIYAFPFFLVSKKLAALNDITAFQNILNTPSGQRLLHRKPKQRDIPDDPPYRSAWVTWLIQMIQTNRMEFVNLLLNEEADPTIPDSDGNTPLMKASYLGYEAIVQRLLEIPAVKEGINLRNTMVSNFIFIDLRGTTAFFQAVSEGHLPVMDLLLEADADPTIPDVNGNTPLIEALSEFFYIDSLIKDEKREKQGNIVKRLLSLKAVKDPAHLNAKNQKGGNALSLVEEMLEKEPNAPLFLEIRKQLLDNGALPPQNKSGKKAEKKKSLQTKKIDKNPPVTSKDKKKNQPLRETAQEEKKKIHSEESFWQGILSDLKKLFP